MQAVSSRATTPWCSPALLVGAGAQIYDNGALISDGWYATGDANWFPLRQPIKSNSVITATQTLCGNPSKPSDPAHPEGRLTAPIVLGPICSGARFVVLRSTIINSTVVVMRNGSIVAYGGAAPGDVILALGGNASFNAGDHVTAIQYMGSNVSPPFNTVTVVQSLGQPAVEILGGEPFFVAKGNEQSINGSVFPRGRGDGPQIRIQACCEKKVHTTVFDPGGMAIAELALAEIFPGYFTTSWPWSSTAGWALPGGIPVGRYTVVVKTECEQKEARVPFNVIFDPAEVNGPARFSFDATAAWFGTGLNSIRGLHYYLHPSDQRVFSIAINAISGMTNAYDAAIEVARAEEQLFGYSLTYHTQDLVDLLVNHADAQCADDACCLTALLRAVGIPAHPVTADAALETGAANWTFDTWVEFLAERSGSTEWRVLHPHEYPGMQPESRATFGITRGVATWGFNDLVVMAGEDWVMSALDDATSDVTYTRNSCGEPNQQINKAPWIVELCEAGYWSEPHRQCTRSMRMHTERGFRLIERDLSFGGRLAGTVDLINGLAERSFGTLHVQLIEHRPESKQFAEKVISSVSMPVTLDHKQKLVMPFEVKLPATFSPEHEIYLWAHVDGRTVALQNVRIPAQVAVRVKVPRDLKLSEETRIKVAVINTGGAELYDVMMTVRAPWVFEAEPTRQQIGTLKAHEQRDITLALAAHAPLVSGVLELSVSTANGGGALVRRPLRVLAPPSMPQADPASRPHYKQGLP